MIRPASPSDAIAVVPLIIQAMGKLAQKLTNVEDENVINQILKHFFMQRGNQYSYENTLVFEEEGKRLCLVNSKVMMMRQGKIIFSGTDESLRNSDDAYIQRFLRGR